MTSDLLAAALLVDAAWVTLVVAGHFTLFRRVLVVRRSRAVVLLFGAGLVGQLLTCLWLGLDGWRTGYGVIGLFCAFILYMPFYYMIATSVSARILTEIYLAPAGLSLDDLRSQDRIERMLTGRLQTLVAAGYLVPVGERFATTRKGRAVAQSFRLVKALWRLGPGG